VNGAGEAQADGHEHDPQERGEATQPTHQGGEYMIGEILFKQILT
jgi:hypothetical protein